MTKVRGTDWTSLLSTQKQSIYLSNILVYILYTQIRIIENTYIHTLIKEKYTKISYNRQTKSIRSECFETTQLFASDTNDNECNVTNVK